METRSQVSPGDAQHGNNAHTPALIHTKGPMASTEHGKELEEAATVRKMVQQNPARGGQTHRPAGWKRRRPRPRLSHKGPMPF
ncbi:apelin isoform X1 [Takifugu rubripes]|uniref:apelin isoform X1 n=1 Tax=Takifugu rubripes TaxID=31033 RepID=UPI001145722B|nr:apelin isoform X1 [Takifugu rubripes]XP_056899050.1 apelin isoform X1 [Takifugu flavidus]